MNERILFALLIADREEQASIARKLYGPGNYVFLPVCPDETVTKNDIIRTTFEQDRACTLITVASIGGKVLSFSKEIPQIKEIIDGEKLIANMRKKQIYPSVQGVISITATGKTPIVKIMKTVLSKENTVRYLRYACIMSVGALFTHFNIYYTVSACILLGLSLASFIRNKRQSRKIF